MALLECRLFMRTENHLTLINMLQLNITFLLLREIWLQYALYLFIYLNSYYGFLTVLVVLRVMGI